MNSFFFWLTIAAALGALVAQTLHAGAIEVIIVAALANLGFYGYRRLARSRKHAAIT